MIERPEQLRAFVDAARACGEVALDTEFLRERTYLPQLCLIQAAYADAPAQCIDPLALDDLSPLNELLGDARVVKIFHSCRQDLEALDSRFEFRAANIYDTQLAAAFCGFGEQVSYAALVDELCAVHLPKAHTRADWSRRRCRPSNCNMHWMMCGIWRRCGMNWIRDCARNSANNGIAMNARAPRIRTVIGSRSIRLGDDLRRLTNWIRRRARAQNN